MTPEEAVHFMILETIQKNRKELDKTELEAIKYLMSQGFSLPIIAESIGLSHQGLRHRLRIGYYCGEVIETPRQKILGKK